MDMNDLVKGIMGNLRLAVARYVPPMARAGIAAGADGLIIEVHPCPREAKSDGPQSLTPEQFAKTMQEVRAIAAALGRDV